MNYLSDAENLNDLVGRMPEEDRAVFSSFGHMRVESGFVGRLFVVYRATGLNVDKTHKNPEILTTVRLGQFQCDSKNGASVVLTDNVTGQTMTVGHTPARLFHYPIFVAIPPHARLRWDARPKGDGEMTRTLAHSMLIKARNRSDFYSMGNTYCETPNDFRALFPDCTLNLNYV